jgi:hypothetical protein
MKAQLYSIIAALVLVCSLQLVAAQQPPDNASPEIIAIRQKIASGTPLTPEETQAIQQFRVERAKQVRDAYLKDHTPQSSTGLIALPDLGKHSYKGEEGGLYPGGSNTVPAKHLKAGLRLARTVRPLDANGQPAADGKIVLLAIGFSNPNMEFPVFAKAAYADQALNPRLVLVNGCVPGMASSTIANPKAQYWDQVARAIKDAGVTAAQVEAVWLKEVVPLPKMPFPVEARQLQGDMENTLHILHDRFPNLKLTYLATRTYGGYTEVGGSPEPWAYETGFGVKWVIADQLAKKPEMNFDSKKIAAVVPWVEWGPYFWTDGIKGRKDGFVYLREDVGGDGLHPSEKGEAKIAALLLNFFKTDPTTAPWFLKPAGAGHGE